MEPERDIEKLLRAYAKKRRSEAGDRPELHPATRRLLQSEVARRRPKPGRQSWIWAVLAALRPRVVYVLCGLAVVVLAVAVFLPGLHETKNARLAYGNVERPPEVKSAPAKTEAVPEGRSGVAPASAAFNFRTGELRQSRPGAQSAAKQDVLQLGQEERARQDLKTRLPIAQGARPGGEGMTGTAVPTLEPAPAAELPSVDLAQRRSSNVNRAASVETNAVAGVALRVGSSNAPLLAAQALKEKAQLFAAGELVSPGPGGKVGGVQAFGGAVPQQFQQIQGTPAPSREVSKIPVVLASFAVEQSGADLRIVDKDGSIYRGYVEPAKPADSSTAAAVPGSYLTAAEKTPTRPARDLNALPAATRSYFFRVVGTNRSLNQNVIFSGNLLPETNGIALDKWTNAIAGQVRVPPAIMPQLPLANTRISGTAVIDNHREIQIRAVPAAH